MRGDPIEYDAPVFKVLTKTDIGASSSTDSGSHQAGPVITRNITGYFPDLDRRQDIVPSVDIEAELYLGQRFVRKANARYQKQTWGGTRAGEYRITRDIKSGFLDRAAPGDICIFQRRLGTTNFYRLTLEKMGTPAFISITSQRNFVGGGNVARGRPVNVPDLEAQIDGLNKDALGPFNATEPPTFTTSTVTRRLRSEAFQKIVREQYGYRCALCSGGFTSPAGPQEVEAAHIVARGSDGTNDPRNGMALCQSHHWAFDRFLWTVRDDGRTVVVPKAVLGRSLNSELARFDGKTLRQPINGLFAPAAEALRIHRDETFAQWT